MRKSLVTASIHATITQAEVGTGVTVNRRESSWLVWTTLTLILASNLPYFIAWAATPADAHFTGLVFNLQDGHTYIAKMRQGFEGSWRFQLPFTPERSPGAYIYLFYLWLGHLSRWAGLPLIGVYHGARVLGGIAMLVGIYALASHVTAHRRERGTMFLLTSLGSGLGWLVVTAGGRTADFWVAEAFPAYSLMINAHFPLSIALMASIAMCGLRIMGLTTEQNHQTRQWPWGFGMILAALLLGGIQPFGLVPVFGALGAMLVARALKERSIPWRAGIWVVIAAAVALPYPLYMQAAIQSDPVLAEWNAQNTTPSPPLWDWALSYGLPLVLALAGAVVAVRRGSDGDFLLLGWVVVTLVGMVLPLPLQRRLSIGLGVPIGLLAGMGWWRVGRTKIRPRRRGLWRGLIIAFSALTMVFLITMVALAALSSEPWFYLSSGEWKALRWLREEAASDAVVLCAPQTGTFVPAWAGQPVVYGHPFETLNAERREKQVKAYWSTDLSETQRDTFLQDNRVRYVIVGPRERALSVDSHSIGESAPLAFETECVKVFQISEY
jgi:hypothetical protein